MVFVNKMDRENANYDASLDQLKAAFGPKIAPVYLPIGSAETFRGYGPEQGYGFLIQKVIEGDYAPVEVEGDAAVLLHRLKHRVLSRLETDALERNLDLRPAASGQLEMLMVLPLMVLWAPEFATASADQR